MSLKIFQIEDKCTGCGVCVSSCPKGALSFKFDKEGFYYPVLDVLKCVGCKICEKSCHVLNGTSASESISTQYMIKSNSSEILSKSSSGGVFSMLSEIFLKEGGIIFGAAYNFEKERLEYSSTDEVELDKLRRSKYIECYSGDICKRVEDKLNEGRTVLLTGTPCLISALRYYLLRRHVDCSKLLLVRFICHGVPSNMLFTSYKYWVENKYKAKLVDFNFRPKVRGWRNTDMRLFFDNGFVVTESKKTNLYYSAYYEPVNLILRKSCYTCNHLLDNDADLTIGDFWGIKQFMPLNVDNEGLSLVIAHNDKGRSFISKLDAEINLLPRSAIEYIYKDMYAKSSHLQKRNLFMSRVVKIGYEKYLLREYFLKCQVEKVKEKFIRPYKAFILGRNE